MGDNVRVAVRVRPFNQREKDRSAKLIIAMDKTTQMTTITNPEDGSTKNFTYDFSYNSFVARDDPEYTTQGHVWNDLGVGILTNAFEGYNCSLFAYGQTGAGKSYSMMGYGADRGIIPIASEHIFDRMHANTDPDLTIKVTCSMLEIYMEKTRDLFNPNTGELKIRNDPKRGFFVEGLTQNAVADYESIAKLMDAGSKARTVASTAMNATSSRAHTIFQIILTQTKIDRAAGNAKDKVAIINLIDLAGSERAESTGATGDRLKEGAAINLSLTCLGNVISALAFNSDPANKKKMRVPYRDSVLTMLLQNSLGGNAKTIMIAALSPADINYDETLSTLRYADRAKQIKNKAVVNEDPNEKIIKGLRDEIEQLKAALAAAAAGGVLPAGVLGGAAIDADAERQRIRAEMEAEREREMARIREELESKLKMELEESKSWEEKLAETKHRAEQRELELREMGVVTGAEREAMLAKAQTEPHMTNLHEDPMMSEQVLFFFDPEHELTIGRKDATTHKDVKLGGLSIAPDHAVIRNVAGIVTVEPATAGAKVYVNGDLIVGPTQLHHFSRIVFGTSHVYKVVVPEEAAAGRKPDGDDVPEVIDYSFAINEINKAQVKAIAAQEAQRRREMEEEKRKADERIAELEARMKAEREAAEREAMEKIRQYEERAKVASGNDDMVRKLKAEQERLEREARARQEELERKLQAQIEETEKMRKKKEKESREKSLLDEKLLKTIPLVNEANAISEELGKRMTFEPKLMANQHKVPLAELKALYGEDAALPEQFDTELYVRVEYAGAPQPPTIWHYDKFMNRLYIMREMYQLWSENGKSLAGTDFEDPEKDPFFDPPEDQLIGKATIYLESLQYVLPIEEKTPIIDYKGVEQGELLLRVVPHAGDKPPASALNPGGDADDDEEFAESLDELKGKRVGLTVFVDAARGLPAAMAQNNFVKFRFYMEAEPSKTPATTKKSINPAFGWHKTFTPVVTDELIKYVGVEALEFEVWGRAGMPSAPPAGGGAAGAAALPSPSRK